MPLSERELVIFYYTKHMAVLLTRINRPLNKKDADSVLIFMEDITVTKCPHITLEEMKKIITDVNAAVDQDYREMLKAMGVNPDNV